MSTSRWAEVTDALVTVMRAVTGYRTPGADADESLIIVFDGPEWLMSDDPGNQFLIIGGNIEDDQNGLAGQAFGPIGNRARDEAGSIVCNAVAQLGGIFLPDGSLASSVPRDTWSTLRAAAFANMGAVESALRSDPTLALSTLPRLIVQIGESIVPRQYMTDGGAVVSIVFTVTYDTRI